MSELDRLIEAVETGNLPEAVFHGTSSVRGHWAYTTGLEAEQRRLVYLAYLGSLDAAKRLHDALLPGWTRDVDATAPECGITVRLHAPTGYPRHPDNDGTVSAVLMDEARAWLLAILRAVKAREGK